jgi:hypothetical protein
MLSLNGNQMWTLFCTMNIENESKLPTVCFNGKMRSVIGFKQVWSVSMDWNGSRNLNILFIRVYADNRLIIGKERNIFKLNWKIT